MSEITIAEDAKFLRAQAEMLDIACPVDASRLRRIAGRIEVLESGLRRIPKAMLEYSESAYDLARSIAERHLRS
jgi:hypothetical protein